MSHTVLVPGDRLGALRHEVEHAVLDLSEITGLSVEATAFYCILRGIIERHAKEQT